MIAAIIMGAVGLVLLMGCANIAACCRAAPPAAARWPFASPLGAGRGRVLRQLFTESLVLGVAGGALGLLVSLWTADLLPSSSPPSRHACSRPASTRGPVLFTMMVSIVGSLVFGLAPAWQGTRPHASVLRGDAGRLSDGPHGTRLRRLLVAAQVALAVVLLVSAGLLVQSLRNVLGADPGFGTRRAVLVSVEPPASDFDPAQRAT